MGYKAEKKLEEKKKKKKRIINKSVQGLPLKKEDLKNVDVHAELISLLETLLNMSRHFFVFIELKKKYCFL